MSPKAMAPGTGHAPGISHTQLPQTHPQCGTDDAAVEGCAAESSSSVGRWADYACSLTGNSSGNHIQGFICQLSPSVAPYTAGDPSRAPYSTSPSSPVSSMSCSADFSSWTQFGAVCGESDGGWACAGSIDLAGARGTCEGVGARLCSATEVVPAARNTGCGHNARYVWTATPCDNGHMRVKGNNADDQQCALDGDTAAVRCCADQHEAPVTAAPTKAPVTAAPTKAPVTAAPTEAPVTAAPTKAP
eukprot:gene58037-biopygen97702